jgi:hypothetical protein
VAIDSPEPPGHNQNLTKVYGKSFLEKAFACVLAAFLSSAVNRSRVIGCIFFRVSSSGSKFFFVRFIAQLYHAPQALRIEKTDLLFDSFRLRGQSAAASRLKMLFRKHSCRPK